MSTENPDDPLPTVEPTRLRTDPTYAMYFNCFRLITAGIIPFGLLVFFNFKIYMGLKLRRKRKQQFRAVDGGYPTATSAGLTPSVSPLVSGKRSSLQPRKNNVALNSGHGLGDLETMPLQPHNGRVKEVPFESEKQLHLGS